jgi:hypothetical protein
MQQAAGSSWKKPGSKGHQADEICRMAEVRRVLRDVCCRDKAGGRILLSYVPGYARKNRSTFFRGAAGQRREGENGPSSWKDSGIKAARDDDDAEGAAVGQEGDPNVADAAEVRR